MVQQVTIAEVIVENNATENGIPEEPLEVTAEEEEDKEREPLDSLEPTEADVNENETIHAEITPHSPPPSVVHSSNVDHQESQNEKNLVTDAEINNSIHHTTSTFDPPSKEKQDETENDEDDLIENNNNVENNNLTGEVITESVNENEEIQEISTRFEEPIEVNVQTVITDESIMEEDNFQDKSHRRQHSDADNLVTEKQADDDEVVIEKANESKNTPPISPPKYEFKEEALEVTDENHNKKIDTLDAEIKPTEVVLPPVEVGLDKKVVHSSKS